MNKRLIKFSRKRVIFGICLWIIPVAECAQLPTHAQAAGHWSISITPQASKVEGPRRGNFDPGYPSFASVMTATGSGYASIMTTANANNPTPTVKSASYSAFCSCGVLALWMDSNGNQLPGYTVNRTLIYGGEVGFMCSNVAVAGYQIDNVTGVVSVNGSANSTLYSYMGGQFMPLLSDPNENPPSNLPSNAIVPNYLFSASPNSERLGGGITDISNNFLNGSGAMLRGRGGSYVAGNYGVNMDSALGEYTEAQVFPASYWANYPAGGIGFNDSLNYQSSATSAAVVGAAAAGSMGWVSLTCTGN